MTRFRLAGDVAWIEVEGDAPEAVAARVPEGPPHALHGPSALIWLAAIEGGTADDVVARVAESSGWPPEVVADDVRRLLDELVALTLLTAEP